ncbi:hypothetical protein WBG78_06470 [Chryseolinea sp. T2]|uniref:hypothetical protein n=1 Tax=Chryseolinea sp. T2 TaxID=3129255 RepID=UPI003078153D
MKGNNNVLLQKVTGMLGGTFVVRQVKGQVVISIRPQKRKSPTDHQLKTKARFGQAVDYSKAQMANPAMKELYATGVNDRLTSPYSVAVTDYLKAPEIREINTMGYSGRIGDEIRIFAVDDFRIQWVTVEIYDADGVQIESGEAQTNVMYSWIYEARVNNPHPTGSRIVVRAADIPGNVTEKMLVISPTPNKVQPDLAN